jgi:hypothetical protein
MKDGDIHGEQEGHCVLRHIDGVRTTVCDHRFEVIATPGCDIREQQTVQALREWIRQRQAKLRESGDLPG